ncbi:MAG TPA: copper resistance protein CopC [Anaerolineales bacterium]|nr:copper resistance protein CopC [Anaerolineales bacterium]
MRVKRRILWLILIVLLLSAVAAVRPVSAHAVLLRSNPQANAVLAQPPVQVELFFSEALEPKLSLITVIDSNGAVVDAGDVRVDPSDPTRMTVTLHVLADGVYTVSWKALSAIDGHQTVGTYPFAVGDVSASAVQSVGQSSRASLPFAALLSKFLLLASLAILVGQRLFSALVWDPALEKNQVTKPGLWITLYRIGLIGVLISIGIGILSQAGQATGAELTFPWDADAQTGRILTETRLGVIWLLRVALAMFAVWLAGDPESSLKNWIGLAVNLSLLFTVTLTSHAATEARPLLPILGDWLHLIGMTFWFGGLVYLFTGIRHLQQLDAQGRTPLTSLLASRFSMNAIFFVALIGLTGIYSAYLRVGSWSALLDSLYGHALLVKQAFVAGLLVIAAMNFLVITPRLDRDRLGVIADTGLVERFGKILMVELTLAGLLLASVSFLTYLPPARVVSPNSDLTARTKADDLKLDLSISPGRVGVNTFKLRLSSSEENFIHTVTKVLLRFTPDKANLPPSEIQLIGQGDGTFTARGANMSLPGRWQVQAVVRREQKFDAYGNFDFDLRASGAAEQASAISRESGLLLLLIGLACGLLAASSRESLSLRLGVGAPTTLLMIGLGIFYLTRSIPVETTQINPIPPNKESVAAGQNLYTTYCVPCHGVSGLGDGPVGLTLNPRPADLRQHAIPGIHTDAQLFEWITNGFPGSQMPPFKTTLSDTDRWNLVNYIRTLAPR